MFEHDIRCALCLARRVEVHDIPQECNAIEVCTPCLDILATLDRRATIRRRAGAALDAALREFAMPTVTEAVAGLRALGAAA